MMWNINFLQTKIMQNALLPLSAVAKRKLNESKLETLNKRAKKSLEKCLVIMILDFPLNILSTKLSCYLAVIDHTIM